jgi:hypothetical protein
MPHKVAVVACRPMVRALGLFLADPLDVPTEAVE